MDNNKNTFKDFIMEDLDVFFDLDEMATEHELEGKFVPLIISDNQSNDKQTGMSRDQSYASQEVFKQYKTVYVKAADFYIPKVDSVIVLDGHEYYVEEAGDEKGVIRIVISANES
ncbi:MAG: hypothetical protein RR588_12390 [Solibacillus sp.]